MISWLPTWPVYNREVANYFLPGHMTKQEGDEDKLPIPAVSLGDAEKKKKMPIIFG